FASFYWSSCFVFKNSCRAWCVQRGSSVKLQLLASLSRPGDGAGAGLAVQKSVVGPVPCLVVIGGFQPEFLLCAGLNQFRRIGVSHGWGSGCVGLFWKC